MSGVRMHFSDCTPVLNQSVVVRGLISTEGRVPKSWFENSSPGLNPQAGRSVASAKFRSNQDIGKSQTHQSMTISGGRQAIRTHPSPSVSAAMTLRRNSGGTYSSRKTQNLKVG